MSALLAALLLLPAPERAVDVGGTTRRYLLHVPAGLPGPAPLVIAFHGGASNAAVMRRYSGLDAVADRHHFVVAYPEGSGRLARVLTWNAGRCCGLAAREDVDDVAFTRALVDDVARVVPLDRRRVYATGMSNGGMMAYRLAAEAPDLLAAIAPVACSFEGEQPPRRALPIVHFHGTEDRHVPLGGGAGPDALAGVAFRTHAQTLAPWLALAGCRATAQETRLPDRDPGDGTRVVRRTYEGCREGADLIVYLVEGGGHSWPGTRGRAERLLGPASGDIVAGELMWEFFAAHQRAASAMPPGS